MEEVSHAHTRNEVRYFLMVTSCERCGGGPLIGPTTPDEAAPGGEQGPAGGAPIRTRCKRCHHQRTFRFRWDGAAPAGLDDPDCINPSPDPSRIVDLAQWVALYFLFQEDAQSMADAGGARERFRQAARCLEEALKFFGDEELPPETAFRSESSRAAFRANPANYARTHLRDLQAMLPAPAHPSDFEPPLPEEEDRSWWQRFWGR